MTWMKRRRALKKVANDMRLGGVADAPEGSAATQQAGEVGAEEPSEIQQRQCRILNLSKNYPPHHDR